MGGDRLAKLEHSLQVNEDYKWGKLSVGELHSAKQPKSWDLGLPLNVVHGVVFYELGVLPLSAVEGLK